MAIHLMDGRGAAWLASDNKAREVTKITYVAHFTVVLSLERRNPQKPRQAEDCDWADSLTKLRPWRSVPRSSSMVNMRMVTISKPAMAH